MRAHPTRLSVAIATSLLLMATSLITGQNAHAETPPAQEYFVQANPLRWNVKDSWYKYITGKAGGSEGKILVAKGAVHESRRNRINWGLGTGTCSAEGSCTISYPSIVQFTKHNGALDLTLENLRAVTEKTSGKLVVDIRSKAMDSGEYVEAKDYTLATFTLAEAVDPTASNLTIKANPVTFSSDVDKYFSQYSNEEAAPATFEGRLYPLGVDDANGILWEPQERKARLATPMTKWAIIKDFMSKAQRDSLSFKADGEVRPLGDSLEFTKPSVSVDQDNLVITYPGSVTLSKSGDEISKMSDLTLTVKDRSTVEVEMTTARTVDGELKTEKVHIGTIHGKVFFDQKSWSIYLNDGVIAMDPESTLKIPYLATNDDIAPISFLVDVTELPDREQAKQILAVMRAGEKAWLKRQPIVLDTSTNTTIRDNTETIPGSTITVEEENAQWTDSPAPEAAEGQFIWGVKRSWQSYVGKGTLTDGLTFSHQNYTWISPEEGQATRHEDGQLSFSYRGSANWQAYGGILNITLSNIKVYLIPNDPSDLSKGYQDEMPVYANIGNGETLKNLTRLGSIRGTAQVTTDDIDHDGTPATKTTVKVVNQAFYLHQDVEGIFVNVYRGGLRMDNASFTASIVEDKKVDKAPSPDESGTSPAPSAPESGTPSSDAESDGKQQENIVIDPHSSLIPGGHIVIHFTGFQPQERLVIELHSEPIVLGETNAGEDGNATWEGTIPAEVQPGDHRIVARGESREVSTAINISSTEDPNPSQPVSKDDEGKENDGNNAGHPADSEKPSAPEGHSTDLAPGIEHSKITTDSSTHTGTAPSQGEGSQNPAPSSKAQPKKLPATGIGSVDGSAGMSAAIALIALCSLGRRSRR